MTQVSAARTEAREIFADPSGNVLTDALFLRHLNDTLNLVGLELDDSIRSTLSLVQSQREYPLGTGNLNIQEVHIVPENNTADTIRLVPRRLKDIPYQVANEADPEYYYIQPTGGTNGDEFSIFVYPAPARSTADALVIDARPSYELANDADYIPFPSHFHGPIIRHTVGSIMADRDDDKDVAVGERKMMKAMEYIRRYRTFQPTLYDIPTRRITP